MENIYSNFVKKAIELKYLVINGSDVYVTPMGRVIYALIMTFASLVIYLSVALIFSGLPLYKSLKLKDKMFWNLAFVRSIYGIIGTIGCIYVRWFDDGVTAADINSKSVLSYIMVLGHLGFFIFECSAQTFFDIKFKTFSKELHMHHLLALIGYIFCAYYNTNHYYASSVFILEMSTPFSCICWCLIKAEKAHLLIWKINQFLLVHVFHLRSVLEFMMLYEVYKYSTAFFSLPLPILLTQSFGMVAVAFYLTPYWTYRKTQQLFNPVDFYDFNKDKKKT